MNATKTKPAGLLGLAKTSRRKRALTPEGTEARRMAATEFLTQWARSVRALESAEHAIYDMAQIALEGSLGPVPAPAVQSLLTASNDVGNASMEAFREADAILLPVAAVETLLGLERPDDPS
jgi:hypothetical protein